VKTIKTASVEQLQLISGFETFRRTLLGEQYARHLERPLAYWALPTDRRLPLAFLGRTLRDLLDAPYSELAATPGIGQKKMRSFVKLLARVAGTDPKALPEDPALSPETGQAPSPAASEPKGFDAASISEVVWAQWRASVVEHGLGGELLGRLAPSLKNMTRVIWSRPLGAYADKTLAEIRAMKTHGEKRVRAILEVFHGVHALVSQMGAQEHLVVRISPRLIDAVETWTNQVLQRRVLPGDEEVAACFVRPLLEQVRRDASRQVLQLAESRLGIHAPPISVRQAARALGLTRARIYQLLNEISDIMSVRWPSGRHQVYQLFDRYRAESDGEDAGPRLGQLRAALELFYPSTRRVGPGRASSAEESAVEADAPRGNEESHGEADAGEPRASHLVEPVGRPLRAVSGA